MLHYALGDRLVRALTLASRPFFDDRRSGFSDVPLGRRMPVLVHAREEERAALDALERRFRAFATLERLDARGVRAALPAAEGRRAPRASPTATASGSIRTRLLQGNLRQLRSSGGELQTGARVGNDRARRAAAGRVDDRSRRALLGAGARQRRRAWADAVARARRRAAARP